jgi:hypothetical protein
MLPMFGMFVVKMILRFRARTTPSAIQESVQVPFAVGWLERESCDHFFSI